MERWFLIDDGPSPGPENMALDELLLERAERTGGPPVLRLYSFDPPALTIGHHQYPSDILDIDSLVCDGVDIVRRVTGGRALLHDGELTYCIAAPGDHWLFGKSLRDTYLKISRALKTALGYLGVEASISKGGREGTTDTRLKSPCMVSAGRFEITAGGRKIAGSAQRRTKGAFLQHGSILIGPGSERIVKYLKGNWDSLGRSITNVSIEAGRHVGRDEVRSALMEAFSEIFDVDWKELVLSEPEVEELRGRTIRKKEEFLSIYAMEVVG